MVLLYLLERIRQEDGRWPEKVIFLLLTQSGGIGIITFLALGPYNEVLIDH